MNRLQNLNNSLPPLSKEEPAKLYNNSVHYQQVQQINAQIETIVDLQVELARTISKLTTYSACHQVASEAVKAYGFIRTYIEVKAGFRAIIGTDATTVATNTGLRATVLKNYSDFATKVANRAKWQQYVIEGIKVFRDWNISRFQHFLSDKSVQDLPHTSELALYFDALNSGKGTLKALYETNDKLNKEYDELIQKRRALMWEN